jgi:hypothetical protein
MKRGAIYDHDMWRGFRPKDAILCAITCGAPHENKEFLRS